MFEEGFHYAKDQVRFLDPEFNLKPLGPYKRIVNNELVGSYSQSEEDSEDDDDEEGSSEQTAANNVTPEANAGGDATKEDTAQVCLNATQGDATQEATRSNGGGAAGGANGDGGAAAQCFLCCFL